ncbi:hypothetical protein OCH239_17425 [Roseivivax halodurans JCM 10272]|uniref:Uncharacterized protein n=1 Tax=Roseivivax halodurans JCM 10272 TaxID=1449350 RepID=X7E9U2_9RHOB|nr:hypothetical protein [Roseivivax halodurans]ETX12727.1 hypothetical protein OCH239_17425 [Roseivivax halodurans JCM 10272]
MGNDIEPNGEQKELVSVDPASGEVDISALSPETQEELRRYAAMKKIDLQAAVQQNQLDLQTTSIAVGNMAEVTRRMSESGDSVSLRQTIENKAGKTEVLMGNTDEARRGGVDKDTSTWLYIGGGIVVLLILTSVIGG